MPHSATFLNEGQRAVLRWVSDGAPDGVYKGTVHRITARALHNRGLVVVTGRGATWRVAMTAEGMARLAQEDARLAAEAEQVRALEAARLERARARQEYLDHCAELVERVIANGGRLDIGRELATREVARMGDDLRGSDVLPPGCRIACEPTRMDPSLGVTVYLEPDFDQIVAPRSVEVPDSLPTTETLVQAFLRKRAWVTKNQIPRAARIMHALLTAVRSAGWDVDDRIPHGHGERNPDAVLKLPIGSATATIYELDSRERRVSMYSDRTEYFDPRVRVVTRNQQVEASGNLELAIAQEWGEEVLAVARDRSGEVLEDSLSEVVRTIEVLVEEAKWSATEEKRRTGVRAERWQEVRAAAVKKVEHQKRQEQLASEMERHEAARGMLRYADELEASTAMMDPRDFDATTRWIEWIRQHATRTDPLSERPELIEIVDAEPSDLEPHMNGWSPYGPQVRAR